MNLNNVVQIDKDCYSIKYKNDLKDLNYIVNTGSHVHCLEDNNTYIYLGENRWGLIENKDGGSSEGSDLITETLQVTANGIYEAPEGKAYNQVEVEVPNGRLDYIVSWDDSAYDIGNNSVAITSYYPANGVDDILSPVLRLTTVDNAIRTYDLTVTAPSNDSDIMFGMNEDSVAVLHPNFDSSPSLSLYGSALSCEALSALISETVIEASITWHRFGDLDASQAMINVSGRIDVSIKARGSEYFQYTHAYAAPDFSYLDTFNLPNPLGPNSTVPIYRYGAKAYRNIYTFVIGDPLDPIRNNFSDVPFQAAVFNSSPSEFNPLWNDLDGLCYVLLMHNYSGEGPEYVPIGLNVHIADHYHFNNTGLYLIDPSSLIAMIREAPGFDPTDQSSALVQIVNMLLQFGYYIISPSSGEVIGAPVVLHEILSDMDDLDLHNTTVFDTTIKREDVPQATGYLLKASENPASAGLDSIRFRVPETGNVTFYRYSDWYTTLEEIEQHGFKLLGGYVSGQNPDPNSEVSEVEYPLTLIKPSDAGASSALDPYLLGITAIVNDNTIPIGVIMFERYEDWDGNTFDEGIYLMAPEALNLMGMIGSGDYEINMIRTGQPGEIGADNQATLASYHYFHDILGDSHFTGYMNVMDISFPKSHFTAADEGKVVNNGTLVAQTAHATVTQNGTIDTTLNNSVTVNVPASTPVLQQLVVSENSTYTPDPGVDGFDEVIVMVDGGGGSVLETLTVTENGTYTPDPGVDGFDEVIVNVSGGGGSSVPSKDVNFIDYNGTVVYSYAAAEFAELTAMPVNPTHSGLTSQGWNWSLSDAQAYVAKYGKLNVGQMYITDDGKTRIYIHLEEGRLSPYLGLAINGTAVIDWGDGSETNTVTGTSVSTVINTQHTYATAGDYVIIINVTGSMTLSGHSNWGSQLLWTQGSSAYKNGVYQNAVQRVEIGSNITIGSNAFKSCDSLSSITIPNGVTIIEDGIFSGCNSLLSITIPDSVTGIGSNAFSYCYSLTSITIPDSVTTIRDNAFNSCYSLTSITIPDSVKTIQNSVFVSCHILSSVTIPDSVKTIGSNAFSTCQGLMSITIPDSVKTIETNVFGNCYSLMSITIPDSVKTIGSSAFSNCYSLTSITIPDSVTTIKNGVFSTCYGLGFIRFEPTTPPTVSNSTAFSGLPIDCIIYVPTGSLEAYTSATNYPSSSTYTYVEY